MHGKPLARRVQLVAKAGRQDSQGASAGPGRGGTRTRPERVKPHDASFSRHLLFAVHHSPPGPLPGPSSHRLESRSSRACLFSVVRTPSSVAALDSVALTSSTWTHTHEGRGMVSYNA
jgi:hypothetical protein